MSKGLTLPPRAGESDEECRLREALNRHAEGFMKALDSAISLRTAPSDAQRIRHLARGDMLNALLKARHAYELAQPEGSPHNG